MKVKRIWQAVGSFFAFGAQKAGAFVGHTAAVFRPQTRPDEFRRTYEKGGLFDTTPYEERYARRVKNAALARRDRGLLLMVAGAMLLGAVILWLGSLWRISDVRVEGCEHYAPAAVIAASGARRDGEYLGVDAWTAERRIREQLPLVKDVTVSKSLDGSVVISVTEYDALYYTRFHENYYAMTTDGMKVLEVSASGDAYRSMGAVYVGLPEDAYVRVGRALTYAYAPYLTDHETEEAFTYPVEDEDPVAEYAYVSRVLEIVMAWELAPRVTGIELSDRYTMYLVLDEQIKVSLGKKSDLDAKLALAQKVLSTYTAGENPVILDVSDGETASLREDANLILPPWATVRE